MIKQANLFTMGASPSGELCVMLMRQPEYKGRVMQPSVLYDGGRHAILFRNPSEAVILDYVPESYQGRLLEAGEVVVSEFDPARRDIAEPYSAKVVRVGTMPDMDLLTEDELRRVFRQAA